MNINENPIQIAIHLLSKNKVAFHLCSCVLTLCNITLQVRWRQPYWIFFCKNEYLIFIVDGGSSGGVERSLEDLNRIQQT